MRRRLFDQSTLLQIAPLKRLDVALLDGDEQVDTAHHTTAPSIPAAAGRNANEFLPTCVRHGPEVDERLDVLGIDARHAALRIAWTTWL